MGHEDFSAKTVVKGSSDRAFGVVFVAVFAIIGAFPLLFGAPPRLWSFAVAAGLAAIAFLAPGVLAPFNRLWTRFGLLLHTVVSPIVLGIMFYLVVTPTGLLMRLFGKDPLKLRRDPEAKSYWVERTPPGPAPEGFKDQF